MTKPIASLSAAPCFVREREVRADGFVEFDFAVGEPQLAASMILPLAAYHEFCVTNRVQKLSQEEAAALDEEQLKWRYGAPGIRE